MSYMFDSFHNIPYCYIPDNMHLPPRPPEVKKLTDTNLDIILDKRGRKKGYSWNYGETVAIPLTVNIPIVIEHDAYYTIEAGKAPETTTVGHIGQKFYNLKDVKSYFMVSYVPAENSYIWVQDKQFSYPENGTVLVTVEPDMQGKYILAEFLNFRGEQMFEQVYEEVNNAEFVIDIDQSLELQRGIYELTTYVGSEDYKQLTERYEIVIR